MSLDLLVNQNLHPHDHHLLEVPLVLLPLPLLGLPRQESQQQRELEEPLPLEQNLDLLPLEQLVEKGQTSPAWFKEDATNSNS